MTYHKRLEYKDKTAKAAGRISSEQHKLKQSSTSLYFFDIIKKVYPIFITGVSAI